MDLFLDHVSFQVDDIGKAKTFAESSLGFTLTLTPQQPGNRGRMRLDRWYIEVWKPEQTHLGSRGEGLYAIALKSGDIEKTRRFFAQSSFEIAADAFGNNWIMPTNELNIFLGY